MKLHWPSQYQARKVLQRFMSIDCTALSSFIKPTSAPETACHRHVNDKTLINYLGQIGHNPACQLLPYHWRHYQLLIYFWTWLCTHLSSCYCSTPNQNLWSHKTASEITSCNENALGCNCRQLQYPDRHKITKCFVNLGHIVLSNFRIAKGRRAKPMHINKLVFQMSGVRIVILATLIDLHQLAHPQALSNDPCSVYADSKGI